MVPDVGCQGLCQAYCGPVSASALERRRLKVRHGLHLHGMDEDLVRALLTDGVMCPALKEGRCTVYEDRPLICRLWGATESLPCPHGCRPEKMLTNDEASALIRLAEELSANPLAAELSRRSLP